MAVPEGVLEPHRGHADVPAGALQAQADVGVHGIDHEALVETSDLRQRGRGEQGPGLDRLLDDHDAIGEVPGVVQTGEFHGTHRARSKTLSLGTAFAGEQLLHVVVREG